MIDERLLARFERVRELGADERERWLEELAGTDPAAASELRTLLAADEIEESVLERSVHPAAESGAPAPTAPDETENLNPPGTAGRPAAIPERVGPYRIVREIGRGGMGRVFLGEQVGEGFRRLLAVKRLDRRDPTPLSARRFRDEAKILASLEHPGIARFVDGGRDAEGVAYLALEYVEGEDLLTHAGALSLADRLRLFLEVLEAVDFAHERRVVHRDLKPSNVLVGRDGHPKLLDFGISKLIDPEEPAATATHTEQRALTPAYASPEQISGAPVTVASDVYSLGVMLYELLSGVRPFDSASGSAREIERAILEREPEPPSTAARRATTASTKSANEKTTVTRFRLGRDLDAICLKALRKEPERRYRSVHALADDVRAYLEGRPVQARRGGFAYRAGKRLRRQRATLLVALAAAALAAVVVRWAPFATPDARPVRRPPAAPPERPTLAPIGELSARFAENPDRPDIGLALVRALLDAGRGTDAASAVMRLRQLPGDLGKGPAIDLAEAEVALAVSEFQRAAASAAAARDGAEKAGDAALARRAKLIHARTLMRLASPQESERRLAALFDEAEAAGDAALAAEALVVRATAARRAALTEQAPALLAEGLERARALGLVRVEIEGMNSQGRFEGEAGKLEEGLATIERSLALAREVGWLAGEAQALLYKSALLNWKGESRAAFGVAQEAAARLRETGNREQLLTTLGNLAIIRIENGELPEAEAIIAEGESLASKLGTPIARAQLFRGRAYLQDMRGDEGGSRAAYRSAIEVAREAGLNSQLAVFLADYSWFEVGWEHLDAAEAPAREAVALFESGGDERAAIEVGAVVAAAEAMRGEIATARRHMERLRKAAAESDSESARYIVRVGESRLHEALGELPEAIEARKDTVRIAGTFDSPSLVAAQQAVLLKLFEVAGRHDEARALARELLPVVERIGMADAVKRCRSVLGASTS